MAHAITLLLDEASEAEVRSLWTALDDAGVPSLARHGHGRHHPHLTLVVFDEGDPEAVAAGAVAARIGPSAIDVRYAGHGVFSATRCVVHLAVTTSAALRSAHAAMVDVLARTGATCWPHYETARWFPHVTLAVDVLPAQAGVASALLAARPRPSDGRAVRLALVHVESGATRELARLA
jgi:2'-5' RNA ligase